MNITFLVKTLSDTGKNVLLKLVYIKFILKFSLYLTTNSILVQLNY